MQFQFSVQFDPDLNESTFFETIPSKPTVFAIFSNEADGSQAPPYLSRTTDLRRRLTRLLGKPVSSSRRLNLREVTSRIEYSRVGSGFEAQWLLYLLNKFYYPKLYRQRLRLKPPAMLKLNLSNRFPRTGSLDCFLPGGFQMTVRFTTVRFVREWRRNVGRPSSWISSRSDDASKT